MAAKMRWKILGAALGVLVTLPAASQAPALQGQWRTGEPRGRLLYTAYCDKCHSTEVHWRAKKAAVDWDTLVIEVRRWQYNSGQSWDENDILEVARYLNATAYHFPLTE